MTAEAAISDYATAGLTPRGTTISVFDYWTESRGSSDISNPVDYKNLGINKDHVLNFGTGMGTASDVSEGTLKENVNSWTSTSRPRPGIVQDRLGADGYPVLANVLGGESLSYLFNPGVENDGKLSFSNVGGLLSLDDAGYYYYNSHEKFAEFDEGSKVFLIYPDWAVAAAGSSGDGQFFPFNSGDEVFEETADGITAKSDVNSQSEMMNHYFGLTMSTNFVQQFGGHTDATKAQEVTYNFSGDDDVWIFIDDVLVGDLGGIHDISSIEINFTSGVVVVYRDMNGDNQYQDDTDQPYYRETLRTLFESAGASIAGFAGDTFADNTYHSLNFFYLERGGTDSNMSLKYNLVDAPQTDITKVDQEGNFVSGATFQVTDTDSDKQICTAVTGSDGTVALLDAEGHPITIDDLYHAEHTKLTFTETTTPAGYRSVGKIDLYIEHYGTGETANGEATNVLLSSDPWSTGAYAQSKVTATAADTITVDGETLTDDQKHNGMMFVVIEKNVNGEWHPVTGDALNGWHVSESTEDDMAAVIAAGRETNAVFAIGTSGAYQAEVEDLPGQIQDYEFFTGTQYRGHYYYSEASSWDDVTAENTYEIENSNDFGRQFSARVYISNIINRVLVQKVDESGDPVNGATMGLYNENQVTVENGIATLNDGAQPIQTAETETLSKEGGDSIDLNGAAIFTRLAAGTYYVGEVEAPDGYVTSSSLAKVIVDSTGVYADAGTEDDGVSVTRGVGRIVRSMIQFATDDDIDASLHDIVATPMTGTEVGKWNRINGMDPLHLTYSTDEDVVLDYEPVDGSERRLTVETGIPYLKVQQCNTTTSGSVHETLPRQSLGDIDLTNLFTGVTIVHIENERTAGLEVTKTLEKDGTLTGPEGETSYQIAFSFTFPDGTDVDSLPLSAQVFDAEGNEVGNEFKFELTAPGQEETAYTRTQGLKAGETIRLYGLPNETAYTVTETEQDSLPSGVTLKSITDAEGKVTEGADASASGTIAVTAADNQADSVTVTNQYTAASEEDDVDASINGIKKIVGRSFTEGETFEFKVTASAQGLNGQQIDTVPMPSNAQDGSYTLTIDGSAAPDQATLDFGSMVFTQAGIYTYTITEVSGSASSMTYSEASYTVTMTVTDNRDGTLEVTKAIVQTADDAGGQDNVVQGPESAVFTNTYGLTPAQFELQGTKNMEGRDFQDGDFFTFHVSADDGSPLPSNVDSSGNVTISPTAGTSETIDFGTIEITQPGTYTYHITEQVTGIDGVDYDSTTHTVTLVATDDGQGGLDVEMTTEQSALVWTNTWTFTEPVPFSLVGTKTLIGHELANSQFTFKVEALSGAPMGSSMTANFNGDATQKDDGSWSAPVTLLSGIEFTNPGEYTYEITELNDQQVGYTYDTSIFRVTVTVADDGDLTQEVKKSVDNGENWTAAKEVEFVNRYETSEDATLDGATNLSGTKTLSGRDWIDTETLKDSFTFLLAAGNEETIDAVEAGIVTLPEETAVVLQGGYSDGTAVPFSFGDITFSEEGDYVFTITEQQPGSAGFVGITGGMTYDSHVYTVNVSVTDNGQGQLVATVTSTEGGNNWNNTYKPGDTPGILEGATNLMVTKTIDGRDWIDDDPDTAEDEADSFTFMLTADAGNPAGATLPNETTITIDADTQNHQAAFGDITFTQPGDYVFYITEQAGSAGGMAYDTTPRAVRVNVVDNLDGTLGVTVVEGANPTITNVYEQTKPGVGEFQLTKVLEGKAWDGDEFTFELTAKTGTSADGALLRPEDGTIPLPDETTITVSGKDGTNAEGNDFATFGFGPITYSAAGTYVYEIREADGSNPGIDYDKNVVTVTVTVTDDLNGGLSVSSQVEGGFTNIYSTEVDYNAEGGLNIVKNLFGHDLTSETPFEFTLKAKDAASAEKVGMDTMTLEKTFYTGESSMVNGVASTSFSAFGDAVFTQQDAGKTYEYEISETKGGDEALGYTNDKVVYTVSITTNDDGNGTLRVTTHVTGTDGTDQTYVYSNVDGAALGGVATVVFENEYSATGELGGDGDVSIAASKTLVNGLLTGDEFTFEVSASNGEDTKVYASTTNKDDGSIVFPAIRFTTEGLLNDMADGYATQGKNDQGADVYTYQFDVSEVGTLPPGVTQVDASFRIVVTVTDNSNGTLSIAVAYPDGSDSLEFVNAYGVGEKAELVVAGTKTLRVLSGDNAPDITGDYTFTLTGEDQDGNPAPMPDVTETTNDGAGNVTFGTITYTMENVFGGISTISGDVATGADDGGVEPLMAAHEDKVYTYTVTESGSVDGVDNDPVTVRTFTVTVHDNGDGTLSVKCSETPGAQFHFVNTYSVDPTDDEPTKDDGGFKILKTLDGRSLNEGEFTFVLKTEDGKEVSRGTNDAEGNVRMSPVHFEDVGTYEYLLTEVDGNLGGITYDSSFYQVTANVTDNGDGTLSVVWTLGSTKGEPVPDNTACFNNAYDIVRPGSIVFGATKVLDSRRLADGEFTFQLKDESGNVIQEVTNAANGSVVFDEPVYFYEPGEYVFTVSEVLPADDDPDSAGIQSGNVTYDETVYTATVTVVDNGDGSTTVSVSYGTNGTLPAFHNVYVEPDEPTGPSDGGSGDHGTPDTGDHTSLVLPVALGVAGIALVGGVLVARRRRG